MVKPKGSASGEQEVREKGWKKYIWIGIRSTTLVFLLGYVYFKSGYFHKTYTKGRKLHELNKFDEQDRIN